MNCRKIWRIVGAFLGEFEDNLGQFWGNFGRILRSFGTILEDFGSFLGGILEIILGG